ncbi:MAG: hypothetical protein PHU43_01560 [Candidatus Bipolaricaulis sp.]|nr:hypothetical protein [Candidatus Bipolaricaulis sp.]
MGKTWNAALEETKSHIHALRFEIESLRGERRRNDLASALYLATLRGRITPDEARHLAERGLRDDLRGTTSVLETVARLEDGRWDL